MQRLQPDENLWQQSRVQNQQTQPTQIYLVRVQFRTQATPVEIELFHHCANPGLQYMQHNLTL